MITLIRTNAENKDFKRLVVELDKDLAVTDGSQHGFYSQYNKIDAIKYVVVAYDESIAIGCGAIKEYQVEQELPAMEVKRMYVPLDRRNRGIASKVLKELETWAKELNSSRYFDSAQCPSLNETGTERSRSSPKVRLILETGKRQPDAIQLYTKNGYHVIPNYGQYIGVDNSLCFEKVI